ncbi:hypothetical protein F5Y06DRAFT_255377 [Hypoxylon sp. FL0890]|nr:hypothetical protein F5Y06DRAFT_255377 [Hypoxylon sp. FL0890]
MSEYSFILNQSIIFVRRASNPGLRGLRGLQVGLWPTMTSQPSSSARPRSLFGNSTTASGQPTTGLFGGAPTQSTQSSGFAPSSLFSSPTPQAPRSQEPLFGTPINTQANPPTPKLFGNGKSQTTNIFGSSTTPGDQVKPIFFSDLSSQPSPAQSSLFSSRISTLVSSPTPTSRRSWPQVSRSGASPTSTSPPTGKKRSAPQPNYSPTKCPGTPGTPRSPAIHTPASESQSPSEQEANVRPPKEYIDPDGDLCLHVGPLAAEFVVCSKTMARSSPFWKKMLYGSFAEGKKAQPQDSEKEWIVKLPEDNVTAMTIVLSIIHGRFDKVAGYEDLIYTAHLYNLCVLTDKYDMTHVLRPWAKGWSRSVHSRSDKLGQSLREKFCHERLWIAWDLGDQATFEEMAKALLVNCNASVGNTLHYVAALEPPGIYESIQQVRLDIIKTLLKPFNDIIQRLVDNDQSLCERPSGTLYRGACLSSMLGTTIRSLYKVGLWPVPEPAAVQCSLSELAAKLSHVEITGKDGDSHFCSKTRILQASIGMTMLSTPSLLTEAHRRHLEAQGKKSGFAPPDKTPGPR